MKQHTIINTLAALGVIAGLSSCTTISGSTQSDPRKDATLTAMSAKIAAAKTIRVTATHKMDPALGVGSRLENGPLEITLKRPSKFYAIQRAQTETREIAYDGKTLCLMHPGLKHHAIKVVPAASVDAFGDRVNEQFGFRPPMTELLSSDVLGQLLLNVDSTTVSGVERLGGKKCKRLHFVQKGMTGDVWVGVEDNLPLRYRLTFPDIAGSPTWDIKFSNWELNGAIDESLFAKRPASDSSQLQMLKSK